MKTKVQSLTETAVLLPVEDRVYLVEQLLASLDQADVERQWAREAKCRRDEVRTGQVMPVPGDEVYQRVDDILKK